MDNLFIKEKHLKNLLLIFENYCPKAEIWAYGSRVDGRAHEGSDLDLCVKNLWRCYKKYYRTERTFD